MDRKNARSIPGGLMECLQSLLQSNSTSLGGAYTDLEIVPQILSMMVAVLVSHVVEGLCDLGNRDSVNSPLYW